LSVKQGNNKIKIENQNSLQNKFGYKIASDLFEIIDSRSLENIFIHKIGHYFGQDDYFSLDLKTEQLANNISSNLLITLLKNKKRLILEINEVRDILKITQFEIDYGKNGYESYNYDAIKEDKNLDLKLIYNLNSFYRALKKINKLMKSY